MSCVGLEEHPILSDIPVIHPQGANNGDGNPYFTGQNVILCQEGQISNLNGQQYFEKVPHLISPPKLTLISRSCNKHQAFENLGNHEGNEGRYSILIFTFCLGLHSITILLFKYEQKHRSNNSTLYNLDLWRASPLKQINQWRRCTLVLIAESVQKWHPNPSGTSTFCPHHWKT